MPSPSLPWFELARFRRSRATRAALVAVILVPLLYGALYVTANWNPTGNIQSLPAAVVNADEIVTIGTGDDQSTVALGRALAAELTGSEQVNNYDWQLTNAADARRGLADGQYAAVLTIPKSFSADAISVASNDPAKARQGELTWETNDAYNYINGSIASTVAARSTAAIADQVTEQYISSLYEGFNQTHEAFQEAASGADKLAAGSQDLASGAASAESGARDLAGGADDLSDGASTLGKRTGEATRGARSLSTANGQLSDGASQLSAGAAELAAGAVELEDGASRAAAGTRRVDAGASEVAQGAAALDTGLESANGSAEQLATGAETYAAQVQQLADACPPSPALAAYCEQVRRAAAGAAELATGAGSLSTGIGSLATGSGTLAAGSAEVAAGTGQLVTGAEALQQGAAEVSTGAQQLRRGADRLAEGAGQAQDGASTLAGGLGQLGAGAERLATGSGKLSTGAGQLADGTSDLANGSEELAGGSEDLRDGLNEGADRVPTYTDDAQTTLASAAAAPAEADVVRTNAVKNNGVALAPYFSALALWVGALAIYLILRPLSARSLGTTTPAWRVALAGFVPGAVLGLVQVGLLVGVLELVVGIDAAQPARFLLVSVVTGLTFVAINQALIALFGPAGRFLALIFVCLQLTAAGGTYPIATAPSFFGAISPYLPMTHAVHGMRTSIAGGSEGFGADLAALLVWLAIALVLSVLAARKRRNVTQDDLYPALAM